MSGFPALNRIRCLSEGLWDRYLYTSRLPMECAINIASQCFDAQLQYIYALGCVIPVGCMYV